MSYIINHPYSSALFLVFSLFCLFFGKSRLIILLEAYRKNTAAPYTLRSFATSFTKAFRIDSILFLFLTALLFILTIPSFFSSGSPEPLYFLSVFTLLIIILIGSIIREFTYFYFLLSPLLLKGSFEAACNLFFREKKSCLSFGFLFLSFLLLFTFSYNFAILSIVALLKQVSFFSSTGITFVLVLIIFSWYEIFRQALWFHFFQSIARPKDPTLDSGLSVTLEKKIPEMPAA